MRVSISHQQGFTIFDSLYFAGIIVGAFAGYKYGFVRFEVIGAIGGLLVGGTLGYAVVRLLYILLARRLKYGLEKESSRQLRDRLYNKDQYFIAHLILFHLLNRGEDIRGELSFVIGLINSESSDRRRFGWGTLKFAYPEIADQIAEYQPMDSTEKCRAIAKQITF